MSSLESSVAQLIALSTNTTSNSERAAQHLVTKRTYADAFEVSQSIPPSRAVSQYIPGEESSGPTPPFSTNEARSLIQDALSEKLSLNKQTAFHSALSSLKGILNASVTNPNPSYLGISNIAVSLSGLEMPSLALMQWMLQCKSPFLKRYQR